MRTRKRREIAELLPAVALSALLVSGSQTPPPQAPTVQIVVAPVTR